MALSPHPFPSTIPSLYDSTVTVRKQLLVTLSVSVFLLFFQTFMVAPLIPTLALAFNRPTETVGLLIPAYTLPYAFSALLCGVLADRFGRRGILAFALAAFPTLSLSMAFAPNLNGLLYLRICSGITNAGIVVMGLTLIGDLFPVAERGKALGWIFGSIAGGCSFGSTLGGVLSPLIGWRGLFVMTAVAGAGLLIFAWPLWQLLKIHSTGLKSLSLAESLLTYLRLLGSARGGRTYAYIILNGIFHSGVFTWLGVLLHQRFGLGDVGIGLALLGYGVPGMFLGPLIGRIVDRQGRRRLIPLGLFTAAIAAYLLAPHWSITVAVIAVTILSVGLDMTHPLFAGIATTLGGPRRGQAMGMNTFSLFLGFGIGSLLFGWLAQSGMTFALIVFASVQALLGLLAIPLFKTE